MIKCVYSLVQFACHQREGMFGLSLASTTVALSAARCPLAAELICFCGTEALLTVSRSGHCQKWRSPFFCHGVTAFPHFLELSGCVNCTCLCSPTIQRFFSASNELERDEWSQAVVAAAQRSTPDLEVLPRVRALVSLQLELCAPCCCGQNNVLSGRTAAGCRTVLTFVLTFFLQ
jgi:hypothetical protein